MRIYGPYKRKDGRQHIIKISPDRQRTTQSYPRYLMEQHLGRQLLDTETVDHINGNYADNRLENLQLLSRADNIRKSAKTAKTYTFNCPVCGEEATKPLKDVMGNKRQGKAGPFCSRKCAGKYSALHNM